MEYHLRMPVAMTPPLSLSDLQIRDLTASDYHQGFLECLAFLTTVGPITEVQFLGTATPPLCPSYPVDRLAVFQGNPGMFRLRVVEDRRSGMIVGAGTLFVEPKFIHGCGQTGHIEDIVVHEAARGLGLGRKYNLSIIFS